MSLLIRLNLAAVRHLFTSRANLLLENPALRQQLAMFERSRGRPTITDPDRAFWVALKDQLNGHQTDTDRLPQSVAKSSRRALDRDVSQGAPRPHRRAERAAPSAARTRVRQLLQYRSLPCDSGWRQSSGSVRQSSAFASPIRHRKATRRWTSPPLRLARCGLASTPLIEMTARGHSTIAATGRLRRCDPPPTPRQNWTASPRCQTNRRLQERRAAVTVDVPRPSSRRSCKRRVGRGRRRSSAMGNLSRSAYVS